MEHGHSLVIPPPFDESNYAYWKVRMKAFLNQLMRESGTPLNTDRRSPLLLLVSGKLLKKKQSCLIVKLWMLTLMLFLWRNLRESLMLRLLTLLGISFKLCMKAQRLLK